MARTGFGQRFPSRDSKAVKASAQNIRQFRKDKDWSQEQLAAKVGIEQNAVSLIENGRANPTLLVMDGLADALGVPLSDLLQPAAKPKRVRS